ncbi:MAG: TlpA disulfide reductase family protein [Methylotenera sp.]|uniref:TlpA disulfide reductase family protein n=1 Tax=Methylotenera sp. TaxID=2051956 RepID=UPI0024881F1C|nr:TlpA disulfide reductase family protein [Methylotenera sp.]MDI1309821.1 TlpA disulfide reductase family protein [Methylotenera sp.]
MRQLLLSLSFLLLITTNSQVVAAENTLASMELKDTAGVNHKLAAYKGKWVLINYWATWCPPCLEEVPDLVNLYDHRKNKDLMIIGIAFDYKSTKEVVDYVDDMLMSYPIVLGDDGIAAQIGTADVLPTTFIYNPKGELVKIKRGLITKQYIEKIIGVAK